MQENITNEELNTLQSIRKSAIEIATTLGEIGYQKMILDIQSEEQKQKIKDIKHKEAIFFEELRKKYGEIVLDIETGKITPKVL